MQCFALAGLAQILLARDVAGGALSAAEEAMRILDELGDIDEGDAFVRLTYAEALDAAGEHGRASAAIAAARDHLLARAARIVDAAWRRSFLEDVAENARTLALAAEPRTVVDQGSTM